MEKTLNLLLEVEKMSQCILILMLISLQIFPCVNLETKIVFKVTQWRTGMFCNEINIFKGFALDVQYGLPCWQ